MQNMCHMGKKQFKSNKNRHMSVFGAKKKAAHQGRGLSQNVKKLTIIVT